MISIAETIMTEANLEVKFQKVQKKEKKLCPSNCFLERDFRVYRSVPLRLEGV